MENLGKEGMRSRNVTNAQKRKVSPSLLYNMAGHVKRTAKESMQNMEYQAIVGEKEQGERTLTMSTRLQKKL